ncbi:MAG: PmoA family protein [Bacteroidota bacterium]
MIKKNILNIWLSIAILFALSSCRTSDQKDVNLVRIDNMQRIDVFIGDRLFTSYQYSVKYEKPFLYPVNAPNGSVITRGFPLEPRKGERVDHPHQVGLWFNHGSINGIDFWNNSAAIPEDKKGSYGHITVKQILKTESGKKGILEIVANWDDNDGNTILVENAKYIFTAEENAWTIDHLSTLTASNGSVTILDNKEGMFAIRVDRAFEMPSTEPLIFTDSQGNPTSVEVVDNEGVTGIYTSSSGLMGDAVWGTRNDWVILSGTKDNTLITFGIFDHPGNPGYPAYTHARGYGLFSVNNLGQKSYDPKQENRHFNLEKGESMKLYHRFYVKSGLELTPEEANRIFGEFSKIN